MWNEIVELRKRMWDLLFNYWYSESLFSFNWWFLIGTTLLFFSAWLILLDKKRIIEISALGLLIGTIVFMLDTIGITVVLWSYPDRIFPVAPSTVEIHKVHLPIIYMLLYQYCKTWKGYMLGLVIASAVFSFILEPITVWLGIYVIHNWKYIYSFPIYIVIGVVTRWLLVKAKEYEAKK